MNHYLKANRVIENLVKNGNKKFILYPFGEQGMMIKRILNERFGIEEQYILDNGLAGIAENKKIKPVNYLSEIDMDEMLVLLTSDNEGIYSEIRFQLMKYVRLEKIIDVFSYSMYFDPKVYYDTTDFRHPRISALEAVSREIYYNKIEGAIAECGVYRGKFANHMSRFMPDRKLYLFDTFSGFDSRDIDEKEEELSYKYRSKNNLDDTSAEVALSNIAYRANVIVRKGYFPDTAIGLEEERFAFVSLDTDLYKPILAGLEFFWPRLSPGGVIFVDDLRHPELLGVRKAVIEFCRRESIGYMSLPDGTDATAVISKPL